MGVTMIDLKKYENKILQGDNLEILKTLPDAFIDCCITSPPYYGLRDYGTAFWQGGNPNCQHSVREENNFEKSKPPKTVCPKCGARRVDSQIGLEETPEAYIERLRMVFHDVWRVLKPAGTLWLNIGDSYCGSGRGLGDVNKKGVGLKAACTDNTFQKPYRVEGYKQKDLIGIPWMIAFALRADGWYLRQDIIWTKANPMPEAVKDRFCKAHEYIFLLSKQERYYFDHDAALELADGWDGRSINAKYVNRDYMAEVGGCEFGSSRPRWPQKPKGRVGKKGNIDEHANSGRYYYETPYRTKRDVWRVASEPCREAHFALFPTRLITPCIECGCPPDGIVLDPFFGGGTTGVVAVRTGRRYLGCELNPEYIRIAEKRIQEEKDKTALFN